MGHEIIEAPKANVKLRHHKTKVTLFDRYELAPILFQIVLEHGRRGSTWAHIAHLLEEHVLEHHGVQIVLRAQVVATYYATLKNSADLSLTEVVNERQSMAENWIRSLEAMYDQVADSKVLLESNFKERNTKDYVLVSRNLQDIMKLLAEINQSANFNVILRETMQNLVYSIINFIKEYDFPDLKNARNANIRDIKREGTTGRSAKGLSERGIMRVKKGLLQYIISRLPEASDVFVDQENELKAQEVRDRYPPVVT